MKFKAALNVPLVFLLISLSTSFGQQKTEWKGKIVNEDGLMVVKNSDQPLYGEITLDLEEDLCIGNEEDENFMFFGFVEYEVDSEENIFVLDGGNCRIQKFDREGRFLQSFGRKGQGPGEFEQPRSIYLDKKDRIFIYDSFRRNIHIFGKNGKFEKSIKMLGPPNGYGINENGNILMMTSSRLQDSYTSDIVITNPEGKVIKNIASYPLELPPMIKRIMLGNPYSHELYFCPTSDGGGVYAHSSECQFYVLSSSGEIALRIDIIREPEAISQKEKDILVQDFLVRQNKFQRGEKLTKSEVKKGYIFPDYKPFFSGILIDNEGRIYVRELNLYNHADRTECFDVFNREGHYTHKVKVPIYTRLIRNGYSYSGERNIDSGYTKIKRYKITNWNLLINN